MAGIQDLTDINDNPLTQRGGNVMEGMRTIQGQAQAQLGNSPGVSRLTGPSTNLPAQQVPFYDPESVPRIAAPRTISDVAADASRALPPPSGPLARAASMAPAAGAAGILAGGAAATALAGGTVGANPEYFRSSIGDDGLAANIMSAAQPTIADVARQSPTTARTQNGPTSVPLIGQMPPTDVSGAGAGRGSDPRQFGMPALTPYSPALQSDDTNRAANLAGMQNQAAREGDPIGQIIQQKLGDQGGAAQPPAGGDAGQPLVGGKPIMFATFGGGQDSSKAYYSDGSTADLRPGMMSGQPLPADVQAFNRQSAQAGMDSQQPVSIIRGDQQHGNSFSQTVATPNPTAADAAGYMREVPQGVFNAGQDAVKNFQAAQAQDMINRADPTAAAVKAKVAETMGDPNMASNGTKPAGATDPNAAAQLTGDDFLKTLPQGRATLIRMINDGNVQVTPQLLTKNPGLLAQTGQAFPDFDQKDYNSRYQTAVAFNKGKQADAVRAANQAIYHMGGLNEAIGSLNNFNGVASPLNYIVNPVEKAFGDTRQGVFEQKAQAVASELRKVFGGSGGGSLAELEEWRKSLPVNASQEQQKAYLKSGVDLLNGAVSALQNQYEKGMGKAAAGRSLLSPESQKTLDVINGKPSTTQPPAAQSPAPQPATSTPTLSVGLVHNGYRFKGGDPNQQSSWEKAFADGGLIGDDLAASIIPSLIDQGSNQVPQAVPVRTATVKIPSADGMSGSLQTGVQNVLGDIHSLLGKALSGDASTAVNAGPSASSSASSSAGESGSIVHSLMSESAFAGGGGGRISRTFKDGGMIEAPQASGAVRALAFGKSVKRA